MGVKHILYILAWRFMVVFQMLIWCFYDSGRDSELLQFKKLAMVMNSRWSVFIFLDIFYTFCFWRMSCYTVMFWKGSLYWNLWCAIVDVHSSIVISFGKSEHSSLFGTLTVITCGIITEGHLRVFIVPL